MSKMSFEIEIPQGYYTKEALENLIQNEVSKIVNTPINACSSTGENIKIPFEKLFCDNGDEQKELKKRIKEMEKQKEQKEQEKKQKEEKDLFPLHFLPEEPEIEDDLKKDMELLNELFEEKSRHIKKSLELLKKLNVISYKK